MVAIGQKQAGSRAGQMLLNILVLILINPTYSYAGFFLLQNLNRRILRRLLSCTIELALLLYSATKQGGCVSNEGLSTVTLPYFLDGEP